MTYQPYIHITQNWCIIKRVESLEPKNTPLCIHTDKQNTNYLAEKGLELSVPMDAFSAYMQTITQNGGSAANLGIPSSSSL